MIDTEQRFRNSIAEIEYSNTYSLIMENGYEKLYEIFNNAISILSRRIKEGDYSEFTVNESAVLEVVFMLLEKEKIHEGEKSFVKEKLL